jgi:hypothetical protein
MDIKVGPSIKHTIFADEKGIIIFKREMEYYQIDKITIKYIYYEKRKFFESIIQ